MARATVSNRATPKTSQNVLTYSDAFDNAYWTKGQSSVAVGTADTLDPFGGNGATKFTENSANNVHNIFTTIPSAYGVRTWAFSIYAKAGARNWLGMRLSTSIVTASFNLSTGEVSSTIGTDTLAWTESIGNGWYRCTSIMPNVPTGTFIVIYLQNGDNGGASYQGDGTSSFYMMGIQLTMANWSGPRQITTGAGVDTGNIRNMVPVTQNLYLNSQDADGTGWTSSLITPTDGATDPFGGTGAQTMTVDGSSGVHQWFPTVATGTSLQGQVYTYSEYFKAGIGSWVWLGINNGATSGYWNVSSGVAGTLSYGSGVTSSIESVGNGWYRIVVTFVRTAGTSERIAIPAGADNSSVSWAGDSSKSVLRFGGQLTRGANVGPYKATTTYRFDSGAPRNPAASRVTP